MIGPAFGLNVGTPDWTLHTGPCVLDIGLREGLGGVDSFVEPGAAWQLRSSWSEMASSCVGHMYTTKMQGSRPSSTSFNHLGFCLGRLHSFTLSTLSVTG